MNLPQNMKPYEKFTENLSVTLEKQQKKREDINKEIDK